jgi:hypothetical protein
MKNLLKEAQKIARHYHKNFIYSKKAVQYEGKDWKEYQEYSVKYPRSTLVSIG